MAYHTLDNLKKFLDHHSNSLIPQQAGHACEMNVSNKVTVQRPDGIEHGVLKLQGEKIKHILCRTFRGYTSCYVCCCASLFKLSRLE